MMTTRQVAVLLNLSLNTVRRWSDQGTLKAYRIGSRGDRRFLRRDIEEMVGVPKSAEPEIKVPSRT